MIAALFVREDSHYRELGCDCYDIKRNALTFGGGIAAVYHPPCRSWGQLSHFAKPAAGEKELAVWAMHMVRLHGGVLEHPYASALFRVSGCGTPGLRDRFDGVLIPVFQSWWGHRAPKKSFFYVVGAEARLPEYCPPVTRMSVASMGVNERERTPRDLAAWLVETCMRVGVEA